MKTNELFQVNEIFVGYKRRKFKSKISVIDTAEKASVLIRKAIGKKFINHHEEFWIILLDQGLNVLGISKAFQGGLGATSIDLKILFQYVIKANASAVVLLHNHPSNTLKPSESDINVTDRIRKAGDLLGVKVCDHIILSDVSFYSFKEHNFLF